jgi:hypothetical protein
MSEYFKSYKDNFVKDNFYHREEETYDEICQTNGAFSEAIV